MAVGLKLGVATLLRVAKLLKKLPNNKIMNFFDHMTPKFWPFYKVFKHQRGSQDCL